MRHRYLVALGSNRRHPRFGRPERVIAAACDALEREALVLLARSSNHRSRPIGPSDREFVNAAVLVETDLAPLALLALLQRIEQAFGRRRRGQGWSARVLDLDLVLWSGGCWAQGGLVLPHVAWRERRFVTAPARKVAGKWRDPLTGATVRQTDARLTRPRPLPKPPTVRPRRRTGP